MKKIFLILISITSCGFFLLQATSESASYRGFSITSTKVFDDRQCTLVELEHKKSGLKITHIQNNDPENLFAFCFRTNPTKSHGVAHILEHSSLEGSKRFPCRHVIMKMQERSLATFLNAMTAQECTFFPAASQNQEDFYNLMHVYADACFHPLLKQETFRQEGHRLEFEVFDDPTTPLEHKGIVYNEMKGVMPSPYNQLYFAMNRALFPDSFGDVYAGGDPHIIPQLTYEELLQFHKDHYFLGNCLLFLYGNIPLERHLDFLLDNGIVDDQGRPPVAMRPLQPQFDAPRYKEVLYPSSNEGDDKGMVSVGWMLCESLDDEDRMALQLLENVLFSSDTAPLKQKLMMSGLFKEVATMVDADKRQIPFVIFFEGAKQSDARVIESLLLESLADVVKDGISEDSIDRIIAQVELSESELRPGRGPIGMQLLSRVALIQFEGKKAESGLCIEKLLRDVQKRCKQEPGYLQRLVKRHFLDNPHRVTVSLQPSRALDTQQHEEERAHLDAIRSALSEQEIEALINDARQLRREDEDTSNLPSLTLDSISEEIQDIELAHRSYNSLEVHHSKEHTNHISYMSFEFTLPELMHDELWKVGLYGYLLPQLGSNGRSYSDTLKVIEQNTGGIAVSFSNDGPTMKIQTRGLDRNQKMLFELIRDTLTAADFSDRERIRTLITKHAHELDAVLNSQAIEFAQAATLSFHSREKYFEHHIKGLEYAEKVFDLADNLDARLDSLIADFKNLQQQLLPKGHADLLLTCDASAYCEEHFAILSALIRPEGNQALTPCTLCTPQGFKYPIGSNIAFNARGMRTVSYSHPDSPYIFLASMLMSNKYLHPMIRQERGAYGAKALYEPHSGHFYMLSYRDPNIKSTNEIFEYSVREIASGQIADQDVVKAKMSALRILDMPKHAAQKTDAAYLFYRNGITHDMRREFRRKLLTANASDIQNATNIHIAPHFEKSVLVTLASSQLLESRCNQ